MNHRIDQDAKEWDTGWIHLDRKLKEEEVERVCASRRVGCGKSTEPGIRGLGFVLSLGILLTAWPG